MALMSEERRKEMEEEMSRFELEIAVPEESKGSLPLSVVSGKLIPAPPPPPTVAALIPEVLIKAPPPPPPPLSPPIIQPALRPPPPPPTLQAPPRPTPPMRFIPPQLQRHSRPQPRPHFGGMRGPLLGQPGPFPQQGHMMHYGPMGGPHMHPGGPGMHPGGPGMHPGGPGMHPGGPGMHPGGPGMHPGGPAMHPGGPMGPMGPGPMFHMGPGMPMHPMGNHPLPPGFCPPMGPPENINYEQQQQQFPSANQEPQEDASISTSEDNSTSIVASAPTIYAAPFKKMHSETSEGITYNINGKENTTTTASPVVQRTEKVTPSKNSNSESTVGPTVSTVNVSEEVIVSKKKDKKKKIVRMAGGQAWEDNSLLEWDTDDFRIFCGDLGNDVTDEVLIRAFSKYPSFEKAKVVRDKRTNKTKGFGFVSFKDPQDFIKAMREMNGRYVGSRPIKLRKSSWRDRNIDIVKKKQREKEKLGLL